MPKICDFETCRKFANYGEFHGKPLRCKEHKEEYKLVSQLCQEGNCIKSSCYNFENENKSDNSDIAMVKLTSLLGLLLDNQEFANAIIINNNLTSIRDLVEKNRKKIQLNITPILRNEQFRIVTRFLLLNDIYYTINPNNRDNEQRIITFARKEELVKPKELYTTPDEEDTQLGSFRKNFQLYLVL